MSGEYESKNISAANGLSIQSSIVKPQIEMAVSSLIRNTFDAKQAVVDTVKETVKDQGIDIELT